MRAIQSIREYHALFDARVWVLAYGQVVQSVGRGVLMPFMALYFYNVKGFPLAHLGAAWLVMGVVGFLSSLAAGAFADRAGRKPVMVAGLVGFGLAVLAYAFVETVPQYYLVAVVQGLVFGWFGVGSRAAVADITPRDTRVRAYGLLYMANNLGISVGLLLAGAALAFFDYRALFFFEAAAHFAYAVVIVLLIPETFRPDAGAGAPGPLQVIRDLRVPLRDVPFVAFIAVDILAAPAWSTMYNVLAPYLKNYAGLPDAVIAAVLAVNTVMVVALQIALAAYAERRGRTTVLLQAHYLLAWSMLLFWMGSPMRGAGWALVGVVAAAMVVYTVAEIVRAPVVPALIADLAPSPAAYGKYLSFMDIVWVLGGGLGAVIGGVFFDSGRAGWLWPTFCLLAAMNMVGILLLAPRLAKRVAEARTAREAAEAHAPPPI